MSGGGNSAEGQWENKAKRLVLLAFAACLPLSIALQQIALALLLGCFGWSLWRGRRFRRSPLDWPLAVFFLVLLFSSLLSPDPSGSLKSFRRLWLAGAFFAAYQLVDRREEAEGMVFAVVVSASLVAAYGTIQHFTGLDLSRAIVGKESNLDPSWLGGAGTFRTKGLHPSGITYAHNLLFALAFAVALLGRPDLRPYRRAGLCTATVLIVVSLLFSLTRGVWIAALLVLAAAGLFHRGRSLGWLGLVVALPAVALIAESAPLRARALSSFDFQANLPRIEIWRANLDMIAARPLLGWGYGNYKKFRSPFYARYPQADTTAHAHNNLLQLWVEGGALGLIGFLYLISATLASAREACRRGAEPLRSVGLAAFLAVAGFFVAGLTQYNFGDSEVAIMFWTSAALAALARELTESQPGPWPQS